MSDSVDIDRDEQIKANWAEHQAMLDDPDQGHTFEITVQSRGSHKVVGDEHHTDSKEFYGDPWTIRARGWSLSEALKRAAEIPFHIWAYSAHVEEDDREVLGVLCIHGTSRGEMLNPSLACSTGGDEPIYAGDRVHKTITWGLNEQGHITFVHKAWVEHRRG